MRGTTTRKGKKPLTRSLQHYESEMGEKMFGFKIYIYS